MKWNQMKIQLEHCLKKDFPFLYASLRPRLWMSSRWTWTTWSWMTLTPQMLTLMMTFSMIDWDLPTVCSQALYRAYLKEKERPNPFSPLFFSFVFVRKMLYCHICLLQCLSGRSWYQWCFIHRRKVDRLPHFVNHLLFENFRKTVHWAVFYYSLLFVLLFSVVASEHSFSPINWFLYIFTFD